MPRIFKVEISYEGLRNYLGLITARDGSDNEIKL